MRKQLWIVLVEELIAISLAACPDTCSLAVHSVEELIALVKRTVLGPATWSVPNTSPTLWNVQATTPLWTRISSKWSMPAFEMPDGGLSVVICLSVATSTQHKSGTAGAVALLLLRLLPSASLLRFSAATAPALGSHLTQDSLGLTCLPYRAMYAHFRYHPIRSGRPRATCPTSIGSRAAVRILPDHEAPTSFLPTAAVSRSCSSESIAPNITRVAASASLLLAFALPSWWSFPIPSSLGPACCCIITLPALQALSVLFPTGAPPGACAVASPTPLPSHWLCVRPSPHSALSLVAVRMLSAEKHDSYARQLPFWGPLLQRHFAPLWRWACVGGLVSCCSRPIIWFLRRRSSALWCLITHLDPGASGCLFLSPEFCPCFGLEFTLPIFPFLLL
ncbi:hypothetical protein B0H13DRAFT_2659159 [Mycena leptocephala]|nr:hypothetical protein B0H13DRAFT_2659159 [Mycena leptocephala]